MKQKAMIVAFYALLVLIGGIIGYLTANSLVSLAASTLVTLLLFTCSLFIMKGKRWAYHAATALTAILLLFFAYRFSLSYKIAPGGIMVLISGILLTYLFFQRNRINLS